MSAIVDTSRDLFVMRSIIDQVSEREQQGENQMTPDEVIFLLDDICIDVRCTRSALPNAVLRTYHDAVRRRDVPSYGSCNFIIKNLISDMERALLLV